MTTWASLTRWSSTAAACSPSRRMQSSPQVLVTAVSCHRTSRGPGPRGGQASRLPRAMNTPLMPTGPCPCTCTTAARTSWSRWPAAAWKMARLRAAAASVRSARRASPQRRSSSRSPSLPRGPSTLAISPRLALTLTPHHSPLNLHPRPCTNCRVAPRAVARGQQVLGVAARARAWRGAVHHGHGLRGQCDALRARAVLPPDVGAKLPCGRRGRRVLLACGACLAPRASPTPRGPALPSTRLVGSSSQAALALTPSRPVPRRRASSGGRGASREKGRRRGVAAAARAWGRRAATATCA